MTVGTYFWGSSPLPANFGDILTVPLLSHLCGVDAEWMNPYRADLIVSGSTLDVMPDKWTGIVAGAGMLHKDTRIDLTKATVLGLRGLHSLERVTLAEGVSPVIGDPGLLASELVDVERGQHELGVCPHWSDVELWDKYKQYDPLPIPSTGDPLDVIRAIGSCKRLVTSSLHGMAVADSFGIPRKVHKFPAMKANPKEGGEFKFHDYASALGQPIEWEKHGCQLAPPEVVEKIQMDLFDMFGRLRGLLSV